MTARIIKTKAGSGTTLASAIFGKTSPSRQLTVIGISATSDKAASVISVKENSTGVNTTVIAADTAGANEAGQKVVTVASATGFTQGDVLVIQRADGTLERCVIDTGGVDTTGVHELTMVANLVGAVSVGDAIYEMSEQFTIPVANTTVTHVGDGPYGYFASTYKDGPVLFDLDGTSACKINFLTGLYL